MVATFRYLNENELSIINVLIYFLIAFFNIDTIVYAVNPPPDVSETLMVQRPTGSNLYKKKTFLRI